MNLFRKRRKKKVREKRSVQSGGMGNATQFNISIHKSCLQNRNLNARGMALILKIMGAGKRKEKYTKNERGRVVL